MFYASLRGLLLHTSRPHSKTRKPRQMCPLCRLGESDSRRKPDFETPNMLSAMYRATRKSNAVASSHVHDRDVPFARLAAALARKTKRGNVPCESGPWPGRSALTHGAGPPRRWGRQAHMCRRVAAMMEPPVCGRCDERTGTFSCSYMTPGLIEHAHACDLVSMRRHSHQST